MQSVNATFISYLKMKRLVEGIYVHDVASRYLDLEKTTLYLPIYASWTKCIQGTYVVTSQLKLYLRSTYQVPDT